MTKKLNLLLIVLLIGGLLLSACGGGATEESSAGATSGDEKVTLRMWVHTNNAFIAGYEQVIEAYEAQHPNVDIQLENFDYELYIQTLQTAMPAGEEADILQLFGTWVSQYYERLSPVPDDVMTLSVAEDTFYAAPLGGYVVDGKLYGMPQEFNCEYGGVLVNKTLFESAGVTYPPQWQSLDDVVADGVALSQYDDSGTMTVAGWHFTAADPIAASFLAGIMQRGGDYWNSDHTGFTFNTPEAKAELQFMLDAVNAGVVDPVLFNDSTNFTIDAFFQGLVGIGYIGTWAIAEGQANFPDFDNEWDYFFLPPVQGDPVFVADSGWGLAVSPNSQHQDVAWDFIKFATSVPENAQSWNIASGTIPAMPAVAESPEVAVAMPWVAKALEILPYGQYLGNMPDRDLTMYEIIYPHILNVLQGVETVDEALQAIDDEANATFQ
jgi:multiple sugar transport system substrate-binding protein